MSRNEDINTAIWADPEFEELSSDAKLLFIWAFTNEHNNMAGLYKVSERTMRFETSLTQQRLETALTDLGTTDFLSYIDHVILVRSRVKRLRTKTPQIARSIAKSVEKFAPDHPQRLAFMRLYMMEDWLQEHLAILMPEGGWERSSYVSPKVRAAVFERDDYQCVDCDSKEHLSIDHVLPRSAGGSGEMENLATRCRGCNSSKGVTLPEKPINTEPLTEPPIEPPRGVLWSGKESGSGSESKVELPDDFPRELRPHLEAVYKILRGLAERNHSKAVNVLSLANVVMARPRKPLVRAAHDCAAHWDARATPVKDVVAAYRNWLDRADDLAAIEPAPGMVQGSNVLRMQRSAVTKANAWRGGYEEDAG